MPTTGKNSLPRLRARAVDAGLDLRRHVLDRHYENGPLVGPDPIGKVHWRVTRFAKSLARHWIRDDRYVFYQGLSYWILANLQCARMEWAEGAADVARAGCDYIVRTQREDGAWDYPSLFLRKGKLATVEGGWAALALIHAYREWGETAYLEAARKWHRFMTETIGFTVHGDLACVNYYDTPVGMIPNNATIALWLNAELANLTGDSRWHETTDSQIRFLQHAQLASGELPYRWPDRVHLYCFQYNSFEFLDLAEVHRLTGDERIESILERLTAFLVTGMTSAGACRRDCHRELPEVNYWNLALTTALDRGRRMGFDVPSSRVEAGMRHVLDRQRSDGGFDFSSGEYGFLSDRRSYPRYLAMMTKHLLEIGGGAS